jgi:hypothetical protein
MNLLSSKRKQPSWNPHHNNRNKKEFSFKKNNPKKNRNFHLKKSKRSQKMLPKLQSIQSKNSQSLQKIMQKTWFIKKTSKSQKMSQKTKMSLLNALKGAEENSTEKPSKNMQKHAS